MVDNAARAARHGRPHAALPEERADAWRALHDTFVREAREAGIAGRPRCRVLFLGDSITEAMRGTQFSEAYDELRPRSEAFREAFPRGDVFAFGISGDRTQHLLYRVRNGELEFRHPPRVVVITIGTNNVGRDNDEAHDIFLGLRACIGEVLTRLPGSKVLLPGILPRGPPVGARAQMPPAPGEDSTYHSGVAEEPTPLAAGYKVSKYAQPGAHTAVIRHVNRRLAALAAGSGGLVKYVDCAECFLTEDGTALRSDLMRDALHPTAAGMRAWLAKLKPEIENFGVADEGSGPRTDVSPTLPSTAFNHGSLDTVDEQSRSLVEHLVSWTPHALCVSHMTPKGDGPIVYCNDNFVLQTGYSVEEILGRDCRFLQSTNDVDTEALSAIRSAIAEGRACRVRIMNYHKDGTELVNDLQLIPLYSDSGKVTHYLGIQRFRRNTTDGGELGDKSRTVPSTGGAYSKL